MQVFNGKAGKQVVLTGPAGWKQDLLSPRSIRRWGEFTLMLKVEVLHVMGEGEGRHLAKLQLLAIMRYPTGHLWLSHGIINHFSAGQCLNRSNSAATFCTALSSLPKQEPFPSLSCPAHPC